MISLILLTAQVAQVAQVAATPAYDHNGNTNVTGPSARGVAGTLLGTISGPTSPTSGAGFDGTNLTTTSGYDGAATIYVIDQATGGVLSTVPIANSGDFGLGYDSTRSLHVTSNALTDVITTFDSAGVQRNQWFVGGGPVGVAHDSARDVYWVIDWSANTLYSMSPTTGAIITTWSTSAVGCTRGAGVAYEASSDTLIIGGRDQSSIFVVDPDTGALVDSWVANDGGNNPQGLAATNSGTVWQTSWNSNLLSEFDTGGGASGPSLSISGTCPGLITIDVTGAGAFAGVALAYGAAGSFTIPGGACPGTVLGISGPTLAGIFGADASGTLSLSVNVPAGLCGLTVQAVDTGSCSASNTDTL